MNRRYHLRRVFAAALASAEAARGVVPDEGFIRNTEAQYDASANAAHAARKETP